MLLLAGDDLPQIAQIYTDGLGAKDSPTDCTEFTEPSAGDGLPQISQICTDSLGAENPPTDCTEFTELLLGRTSHRLHRSTQMVRLRKIVAEVSLPPQQQSAYHRLHRSTQMLLILGGALVSARLCRLPEQEVHQPSKQWFSHRFHRSTQNLLLGITSHRLHRCNFRGCTCLKCTNQANKDSPTDCTEFTEPSAGETSHRLHRSTQMLLILGGALLARLVHLRQVHPLEGTLTICADL